MGNKSGKSRKKKCSCLCSSSTDSFEIQSIKQTEYSFDIFLNSNHDLIYLINKYQLKFYLDDYRQRLTKFQNNQTFQQDFFSSNKIIYPNQNFHENFNLYYFTPSESILPYLSNNIYHLSKLHEQIRSKCYFIPIIDFQIEPYDDNKSISSCLFISNDHFQNGNIRMNSKDYLSFLTHSFEDNFDYLSAKSIQKWFYSLIIINRTCTIVKQFLNHKNKNFLTCLITEKFQENILDETLTFACIRQPNCQEILDDLPRIFLSNNEKIFNEYIHIDYEQYSFALKLSRWPQCLIDNYLTHNHRNQTRKWPTNEQMNLILTKPLLLIPHQTNDQWKINYDFIEQYIFEIILNELTLVFYLLCQQLFSSTYSKRILIKHCFLNYLEKYNLPIINKKTNLLDLLNRFYCYLSEQIQKQFLPNYFNSEINLFDSNENYQQWFEYINDRLNFSCSLPPFEIFSNRSIIIEILFNFLRNLSQMNFSLNETILLELHENICEKFQEKNLKLNHKLIDRIQMNFVENFEINAEFVHSCLNQIRKCQSSLIFHYTWTIFIQYLHTYINVLWNTIDILDE